MKQIFIIVLLLFGVCAYAAEEKTVIVGACSMNVAVMQTSAEHSKGLLGYTERTFLYDGMLFELNRKGRKVFHTVGMQMPIRIMGVVQISDDTYKVLGNIYKASPGIQAIPIDAPDVLEIPETRYQLHYKRCLMANEGDLP